jgi:hypothetical protein
VPTLVRAEAVTGAGQVTSGGSATGGDTGAGVGALGVPLHPAQQISANSARKTLIVPLPWLLSLVRVNGKLPAYVLTPSTDRTT